MGNIGQLGEDCGGGIGGAEIGHGEKRRDNAAAAPRLGGGDFGGGGGG